MTATLFQFQKREKAKFICSACGADRGCNCNAPAIEKLAQKQEQDRQRSREYRARKAEENQQSRHVTKGSPGYDKLCTKAEALGFQVRFGGMGVGYSLQNRDGSAAIDGDGYEVRFTNMKDGRERLKQIAAKPSSEPAPAETDDDSPAASAEVRKNAHAALEVADGAGEQRDQSAPGGSGLHDLHGDHDNQVAGEPTTSTAARPRSSASPRAATVKSRDHLQWFASACRQYLPGVTIEEHRARARQLVVELTKGAPAETLTDHWRRRPDELRDLLDAAGDLVFEQMSPDFAAKLQLRAKQPANVTVRLRELDNAPAAQLLIDAFGTGRLAKIVEKVAALRAPGGARKSGSEKNEFKELMRTVDETGNEIFAPPARNRSRAH